MPDEERVWLVERSYSDKGLVTIVYATTDGQRHLRKQLSSNMLARTDVTAAEDVAPDRLTPVDDPDERERYAAEATRMAEQHDPDDPV